MTAPLRMLTWDQLAAARPDAFTASPATSLGPHGNAMRAEGRMSEAGEALAEGVHCIWRSFEQFPGAFVGLTVSLLRDWLQTSGDDMPATLADRIGQFNAIGARLTPAWR